MLGKIGGSGNGGGRHRAGRHGCRAARTRVRPGSPTIAFEPRACQPARGAMFTMCTRGAEPNNPFAMFRFRLT
ncbi:hypothetical protein AZ22_1425 [Bordetella bronchiseptica 980-2]|nr:hypothetical protein AZ22_1425 [Bordetella bronchiseptica 980-2]KCV52653.1 hypothetical protein L491_1525 [Bordetella bronchiseptica 3E44]KCV58975.1 hypothetical protein AZ14_1476 [Bordetella bronchiseptica 980]KDB68414.1 hypothetical protein AZ15_1559 [Bordetella bronchiseptica A1-7]KDB68658.1 hypothetical protein AZ21_1484 [Bordetella bronchiseptica B20-10725633]KDB87183.1 hypothetical protein AZ17_1512 [Bordetella bronchiseptica D989]KDB89271.1 hypothetical protein AZ27_1531 [Bordetella